METKISGQEIYESIANLFVQGRIVRALDADGEHVMRMTPGGEMEQVWKAKEYATPEELAYWRAEHAQSSN